MLTTKGCSNLTYQYSQLADIKDVCHQGLEKLEKKQFQFDIFVMESRTFFYRSESLLGV